VVCCGAAVLPACLAGFAQWKVRGASLERSKSPRVRVLAHGQLWGAGARVAVSRCRQARLSGRSLKRQESENATLAAAGGVTRGGVRIPGGGPALPLRPREAGRLVRFVAAKQPLMFPGLFLLGLFAGIGRGRGCDYGGGAAAMGASDWQWGPTRARPSARAAGGGVLLRVKAARWPSRCPVT
jgi:hypothetical protein